MAAVEAIPYEARSLYCKAKLSNRARMQQNLVDRRSGRPK